MITRHAHNCGCEVVVYGDGSAPPDVEYCESHQAPGAEAEIFNLVLAGGESNRLRAAENIRKLDAKARRDLRGALQDTDNILDDVTLAEMRERRPWKL
jgi:hypothetical protein